MGLIREADTHLGTGFLATPYLLPVLADTGHLSVAYELLLQDTPPSWLAMVERGATTVWEAWEGIDEDGRPHESLNHYSKGAVISFLHNYVAGITLLDGHPAYRRFRVAPRPGGGLTWAEAVHDSPYGRIESAWHLDGSTLLGDGHRAAGTVAEVALPDGSVREQGPGTVTYACASADGHHPLVLASMQSLASTRVHAEGVTERGADGEDRDHLGGRTRPGFTERLPELRRAALPRLPSMRGPSAEEAAGAPESGNLSAGLDPDVAVGLGPAPEGHGEPGRRGRGALPERAAVPVAGRRTTSARSPTPRSTGRRAWPTTAGWPTSAPRRRAVGPGRRSISFDDVDLAVADIHWAKEHGLGGVMMPALLPGGTFFFDPALDPVWAACVDVGLPISQHGGSGAPAYGPPGFAAIMTLALEHSFYSGRSLWQMILGGVFERFPDLRLAFVETEADWIAPVIRKLDRRLEWGDDWTGWAQTLQRMRQFTGSARDYWAANCFAGISPFTDDQVPLEELARPSAEYQPFAIGCDNAMFGVDYPHFESVFPETQRPGRRAGAASEHHAPRWPARSSARTRRGLYGFDLAHLAPDIERVGFEVDGSAAPGRR